MKTINIKGFTLIELLVAVLIIGILAAIALPKYQMAVDKAKLAHYETIVKDISGSIRRISLVKNNDWNYTFQELDIDLPGIKSTSPLSVNWTTGEVAVFNWGYCYIMKPVQDWSDGDVFCGGFDHMGYVQTIQLGSGDITFQSYCVSSPDNARGLKLCESFGPLTNYGCLFIETGGTVCESKQSVAIG